MVFRVLIFFRVLMDEGQANMQHDEGPPSPMLHQLDDAKAASWRLVCCTILLHALDEADAAIATAAAVLLQQQLLVLLLFGSGSGL